jgi:hypothetical protein
MEDQFDLVVEHITSDIQVSCYKLDTRHYPFTAIVDTSLLLDSEYYLVVYEGLDKHFGFNIAVITTRIILDDEVYRVGANLVASLVDALSYSIEDSISTTEELDGSTLGAGIIIPDVELVYLPIEIVIDNLEITKCKLAVALFNSTADLQFPILGYNLEVLEIGSPLTPKVLS